MGPRLPASPDEPPLALLLLPPEPPQALSVTSAPATNATDAFRWMRMVLLVLEATREPQRSGAGEGKDSAVDATAGHRAEDVQLLGPDAQVGHVTGQRRLAGVDPHDRAVVGGAQLVGGAAEPAVGEGIAAQLLDDVDHEREAVGLADQLHRLRPEADG